MVGSGAIIADSIIDMDYATGRRLGFREAEKTAPAAAP
jgi:hypothetical protein